MVQEQERVGRRNSNSSRKICMSVKKVERDLSPCLIEWISWRISDMWKWFSLVNLVSNVSHKDLALSKEAVLWEMWGELEFDWSKRPPCHYIIPKHRVKDHWQQAWEDPHWWTWSCFWNKERVWLPYSNCRNYPHWGVEKLRQTLDFHRDEGKRGLKDFEKDRWVGVVAAAAVDHYHCE